MPGFNEDQMIDALRQPAANRQLAELVLSLKYWTKEVTGLEGPGAAASLLRTLRLVTLLSELQQLSGVDSDTAEGQLAFARACVYNAETAYKGMIGCVPLAGVWEARSESWRFGDVRELAMAVGEHIHAAAFSGGLALGCPIEVTMQALVVEAASCLSTVLFMKQPEPKARDEAQCKELAAAIAEVFLAQAKAQMAACGIDTITLQEGERDESERN